MCTTMHAEGIFGSQNPADTPEARRVWVESFAMAGSTFRSIKDATEDRWGTFNPKDGNNTEMLFTRNSLGVSQNGWSLELGNRLEAIGQANKDALGVYRAQLLGLPLPAGARYPVDYALDGFEAQGVSLGRSVQAAADGHTLKVGIKATYLDAKRIKTQKGSGLASVQSDGSLTVSGSTSDLDSSINTAANNFIPRFQNQTPSGSGYAVDVGLHYVSPQGIEVEWTVADAVSEIQWKNVPEITLSGSSTFNGQFPSGRKVLVPTSQTLQPKRELTARVPWNSYYLQATESSVNSVSMFNAGLGKHLPDNWNVAVDYDFYFNALGIRLSNPWFEFAFKTDNPNLDQAQVLSVRIALRAEFN
jgi:hypothetical protein